MKDKVYIGDLKDRISILKEVQTTSTTGSPVVTETTIKRCWSNHKEIAAKEDEDGKIRALFSDAFIIRYDKSLIKGQATDMLVQDADGYKYNIQSVLQKVPKQYLQINTIRRE